MRAVRYVVIVAMMAAGPFGAAACTTQSKPELSGFNGLLIVAAIQALLHPGCVKARNCVVINLPGL